MAKTKKKKRKSNKSIFYYLNPKNLSAEIHSYGFKISVGRTLAFYIVFAIALGICGWLMSMHPISIAAVAITGLLVIPILIRNTYKQQYEQMRFSDVSQYMEQMLYSFRGNKKIVNSLKDVLSVFDEGPMRAVILDALEYIYNENEGDVHSDALKIIEREYKTERLITIHRFLAKVETIGGDFENSIQLLLQERSMWADRQLAQHKERKNKKIMVIGSIIISVALCVFIQTNLATAMEYSSSIACQIATSLMLIIDIIIYAITDSRLSVDWLATKEVKSAKEIQKDYEFVLSFNPKKQFLTKSLPWSLVPLALSIVSFLLLKSTFLGISFLVVLPIFIFQHRISYYLKMKNLRKEIQVKFPRWLMEIALQLQNNSVYTAIEQSYKTAPAVLKPELLKFIEERQNDRETIKPYLNFMSFAKMPEVQSSMKMLYAISQGADNDADAQINDIIRRNNIMLDKAEKIRNDDMLSIFYGLMLAPQLTASGKLVVDMFIFLLGFFSYASWG